MIRRRLVGDYPGDRSLAVFDYNLVTLPDLPEVVAQVSLELADFDFIHLTYYDRIWSKCQGVWLTGRSRRDVPDLEESRAAACSPNDSPNVPSDL